MKVGTVKTAASTVAAIFLPKNKVTVFVRMNVGVNLAPSCGDSLPRIHWSVRVAPRFIVHIAEQGRGF